jgi:hypothetical protein
VVDLGSGGGFDVFLAAKRVGPTGRAVGIDMNKVRQPSIYLMYLIQVGGLLGTGY